MTKHSLRLALAALVLGGPVAAQTPQPLSVQLRHEYDSGYVANEGDTRDVVISFTINVQGATSLRVFFDEVMLSGDVALGNASILRITSWKDGATHEMDPVEVRQWQNSSCYLNGDTVQVEVLAFPHSGDNRVVTKSLEAGMLPLGQLSQCGPTDDRVPSSDPRSARALPIGCTAWIFDDCNKCMGTAGHCMTGSSVIQFNVPPSNANGSLNNPPPEDQYATDFSSDQFVNGGIGFDWAYFGVFPNSNTGLTPAEAQGGWYTLAKTMPAFDPTHTIRITGYGVDSNPPQNNQVQQTNTGPWFDLTGTDCEYQVDTIGGNSGSAVQDEDLGIVIGVHTHAGCSSTSGNHGTGRNSVDWQIALDNPKGVCAAPCEVNLYCQGKLNSQGCIPSMSATGSPSISSAPGDFVLTAKDFIGKKTGLLFYGFASANLPFQGGTLCVNPPLARTPIQFTGGLKVNCTGTMSFDFGVLMASGSDPNLTIGTDVFTQFHARDPGGAAFPVALSNAATFTIKP